MFLGNFSPIHSFQMIGYQMSCHKLVYRYTSIGGEAEIKGTFDVDETAIR